MKKLIAAFLCLALLCTTAVAEITDRQYVIENSQKITSVTGLYTFEIPQDYTAFNPAYADQFIADTTAADMAAKLGVDEATAKTMLDTIASTDFSTADYIYTPDFSGRAILQSMPDAGLTIEYITENVEAMDEMMIAQATQIGLPEDACVSMGILTAGNNPQLWYGFAMGAYGMMMYQFMTCDSTGTLYTIMITGFSETAELGMLESFTLLQ